MNRTNTTSNSPSSETFIPNPRPALEEAAPSLALRTVWARLTRTRPPEPLSDAARVRLLADSYQHSDRGFAADLHAAADRYEHEIAPR